MTDTGPPTNPGDIVRNGQRRYPGGSFPGGGGGGGGDPGAPQVPSDPLDPGPPGDGSGRHACQDVDTARDWNADAAAAEAKRQFESRAAARGDSGLYTREWFAFIYESPNGGMYLGPIAAGEQAGVTPDATGMTPDNVVGFIHNHPGGSTAPSGADWTYFNNLYSWIQSFSSGGTARANQLRHYIIARDVTDPASLPVIRVFDIRSSQGADAVGPEVNPNGMPCQ